nr:MAG TPA: hypothetical protein [Caudoviricetes sp.]
MYVLSISALFYLSTVNEFTLLITSNLVLLSLYFFLTDVSVF